jgi:hypothetical protein
MTTETRPRKRGNDNGMMTLRQGALMDTPITHIPPADVRSAGITVVEHMMTRSRATEGLDDVALTVADLVGPSSESVALVLDMLGIDRQSIDRGMFSEASGTTNGDQMTSSGAGFSATPPSGAVA